jgi:HSP20 family molecular chaperone IbpA
LKIDDNGDLSYIADVSGYRREEISVEVQGNKILVSGEYKEQNEGKLHVIITLEIE